MKIVSQKSKTGLKKTKKLLSNPTDSLEHCSQINKTYFEPSFKSNLVHISIFNEFQSSNCQTVALINLLVASNATPGTIIETKCGLAERKFQGKVELKLNFLFSLEEDPNPFDWVSDLSGWMIFYLHISCILNFRRRKKYWFKPIFFLLRDFSETTKRTTEFILYIDWMSLHFLQEECIYFLFLDFLGVSWHNKQKTRRIIIKSFALFWNIIQLHQLWLVDQKSEKEKYISQNHK